MSHVQTSLVTIWLCVTMPAWAQPDPGSSGFGERKLAAMTRGRVAGKPVDCITLRRVRQVEIIDDIGILFADIDGTRYLNRPSSAADQLDSAYRPVLDIHSPDLCRIDVVKLIDPGTGRLVSTANLGPFIPYTRISK